MQQLSACPVSASSSFSHRGCFKPHHSLLILSRWPPSYAVGMRSNWGALPSSPVSFLLHVPPPDSPFLPLNPMSEAELATSFPTPVALGFLLSFSAAPSLSLPAPYLTVPLQSCFLYFKLFILERRDVEFVCVFHSCLLPLRSHVSTTELEIFTKVSRSSLSPKSPGLL